MEEDVVIRCQCSELEEVKWRGCSGVDLDGANTRSIRLTD